MSGCGRRPVRTELAVPITRRSRGPATEEVAAGGSALLRSRVEAGLALGGHCADQSPPGPRRPRRGVDVGLARRSHFQPVRRALPPRLHRQLHKSRQMRSRLVARHPSGRARIEDMVPIQRRPYVEDRVVAGHWDGDLVMGRRPAAVETLVERRTRCVRLGAVLEAPRRDLGPRSRGDRPRPPHQGHRLPGALLRPSSPRWRGANGARTGCYADTCPSAATSTATTRSHSTRSPTGCSTNRTPPSAATSGTAKGALCRFPSAARPATCATPSQTRA